MATNPYILPAILTLVVVMVVEHFLLRHVYGKPSSLERLTVRLKPTGISDLVANGAVGILGFLRFDLMHAVTLPGIAYLALSGLQDWTAFGGLLGWVEFPHWSLEILAWYVVFDFGYYIAHVLMHKVPFLWRFHKLHHSATEMNLITGRRVSFAERSFNILISFSLLVLVFGLPRPEFILALVVIRQIVELIQHSDLPWDFWMVGKIIAGPRFHRMHHSSDPADYDANYANLFSFWDHLFGTVSTRYRAEGPAVADKVDLGLGSPAEDRKFARWYMPIVNETIPAYVFALLRRKRGRKEKAPDPDR